MGTPFLPVSVYCMCLCALSLVSSFAILFVPFLWNLGTGKPFKGRDRTESLCIPAQASMGQVLGEWWLHKRSIFLSRTCIFSPSQQHISDSPNGSHWKPGWTINAPFSQREKTIDQDFPKVPPITKKKGGKTVFHSGVFRYSCLFVFFFKAVPNTLNPHLR